jgi:hypothetical protein
VSHRLAAALAALAAGLAAASPAIAAPADGSVRIEGVADTLVPRTQLRTTTAPVVKDGVHACSGTSAAGALELATGGRWTGTWFHPFGYSVEQILGESHVFPEPDYFALWINNRAAQEGICGASSELQSGDEVLFFVDRCEFDPVARGCANAPVLPLGLRVPRTVRPGVPFAATVVEYAATGAPSPAAGATVSGGDAPATTNAGGVASATVGAAGERRLRATKPGRARSAHEVVCATSGNDGLCGSPPACATDGRDGRCGTRDRTAPTATVAGIREGRRFARGRAPRRLRVVVASDPSGILVVKLRLTRTDRGRCSWYSGRSERFRRSRCGAERGAWFAIGDREQIDYLLPRPLGRGRYVLDVNAVDKAYNRDDARRRGGNRVVFHVA